MKELSKLLKSLVIVVVVALIPITIVVTIRLHQYREEVNANQLQQNASILLVEIENDYNNLSEMIEFVKMNYNYPTINNIPSEDLERASYMFIRNRVDKSNLSGQFAWSLITQRYEILHRNINNYNRKVTKEVYKIKNIDDVPRVARKYQGGIL